MAISAQLKGALEILKRNGKKTCDEVYKEVEALGSTSGNSAAAKAIFSADQKRKDDPSKALCLAFTDSFDGRIKPTVGARAVEVGTSGNSSTGLQSMSKASSGPYLQRLNEYNEAVKANAEATVHNTDLVQQIAKNPGKAAELSKTMKPVVDAEAIKARVPEGITEGFASRAECVAYLEKEGFKVQA